MTKQKAWATGHIIYSQDYWDRLSSSSDPPAEETLPEKLRCFSYAPCTDPDGHADFLIKRANEQRFCAVYNWERALVIGGECFPQHPDNFPPSVRQALRAALFARGITVDA